MPARSQDHRLVVSVVPGTASFPKKENDNNIIKERNSISISAVLLRDLLSVGNKTVAAHYSMALPSYIQFLAAT